MDIKLQILDSLWLSDKSDIFEAQFIEISGEDIHKPVIIGNMYRPPRDLNKNYETFIKEIDPILKQEAQGPWRLSTALQKISYKCVRNVYLYSKMYYHEKMYILYIDHWHLYYYVRFP